MKNQLTFLLGKNVHLDGAEKEEGRAQVVT